MPFIFRPETDTDAIAFAIATDKVCFIIAKTRAYDAKEGDADPASGSNATDDGMADVLEDKPDDPVYRELTSFIRGMNEDEEIKLVALAWVGHGTFDISEWNDAVATARAPSTIVAPPNISWACPLLGDYLEDGLDAFGRGCAEYRH